MCIAGYSIKFGFKVLAPTSGAVSFPLLKAFVLCNENGNYNELYITTPTLPIIILNFAPVHGRKLMESPNYDYMLRGLAKLNKFHTKTKITMYK